MPSEEGGDHSGFAPRRTAHPLPAELKFTAVLAGAVAASFGLAALGGRTRHIGAIIGSPSTAPRPAYA
jgi:hypothetical protein